MTEEPSRVCRSSPKVLFTSLLLCLHHPKWFRPGDWRVAWQGHPWDLDGGGVKCRSVFGEVPVSHQSPSPQSSHFTSFVQIKPKKVMGLLIPQRIEWKKQNLLLPRHTFQCFQLWLSSCSLMDTNSLERVLVCSEVLSSQLLPAQSLRDTASEDENIIYQCVFNDPERSICAFVSGSLMRMCQLQLNSSIAVLTCDWAGVAAAWRGALTTWIDSLCRDTFSSWRISGLGTESSSMAGNQCTISRRDMTKL